MNPKYITPQIVHYQPEGIPANLHPFQDENHGIAALIAAGQDIANGKKVSFAIAHIDHPRTVRVIDEIVTIGRGTGGDTSEGHTEHAPRYCGEGNDPDGAGSHALIPSWYDYAMNPAAIAAALALSFSGREFFRIR